MLCYYLGASSSQTVFGRRADYDTNGSWWTAVDAAPDCFQMKACKVLIPTFWHGIWLSAPNRDEESRPRPSSPSYAHWVQQHPVTALQDVFPELTVAAISTIEMNEKEHDSDEIYTCCVYENWMTKRQNHKWKTVRCSQRKSTNRNQWQKNCQHWSKSWQKKWQAEDTMKRQIP